MRRVHRVDILGHAWTVRILTKYPFIKRFGKNTKGITDVERRTIYLCSAILTRETTIHEMVHAFFSEVCVDTTDLEHGQFEEVACEMFSKYGERIISLSDDVIGE